jgi:hypothetical protein
VGRNVQRRAAREAERQTRSPDDASRFAADERRVVAAASSALAVVAAVVYGFTAFRTVGGGDSGELSVAAYSFGVAHPPGYPLYTLLAKLFSMVFVFGPIAWRMNLFSAWCDAIAIGLCAAAAARLSRDVWAGVLAAGLFGFSPLV